MNKNCPLFKSVLTNNGICYSFNSQKPSFLWQNGKIVETLEEITNHDYQNHKFKGPELHDGSTFPYSELLIFLLEYRISSKLGRPLLEAALS